MPARNRVTPLGEIVAIVLRGAWTGNRGILTLADQPREIVRSHAHDLWIICALSFRGRVHEQWQPRHFTWLYFHDEAVAFAAGHRPCALCRRAAYGAYRDAWAAAQGGSPPSARAINRRLHKQRIVAGTHRRRLHATAWPELPDGAFVLHERAPCLVLGGSLVRWTQRGYAAHTRRPRRGTALAITPPASLAVLRAGYPIQIDAAAQNTAGLSPST